MRWMGLIAFLPTAGLLTASFFVLFAAERAHSKNLKTYGKVVATFVIIVALLVFSKGVYVLATGDCPMMRGGHMKHMGAMGNEDMSDMGSKCGGIIKPAGGSEVPCK